MHNKRAGTPSHVGDATSLRHGSAAAPLTRRQALKLIGAGAGTIGMAGVSALGYGLERRASAAEILVAALRGERNEALLPREELIPLVQQALARWHEAHRSHLPPGWRAPLDSADIDAVIDYFSTMVEIEARFGDWLERAAEGAVEAAALHMGNSPVALATWGPAELHTKTVTSLAASHREVVAYLTRRGLYEAEAISHAMEREAQPPAVATAFRLDDVGAEVWGALYTAHLTSAYGRHRGGIRDVRHPRVASLTWAAYSARPTSPAVAHLQQIIGEVGLFGGWLERPPQVDGAWGPETDRSVATVLAALQHTRSGGITRIAHATVVPLQRSVDTLLRSVREGGVLGAAHAAAAALEVAHQMSALQRALWLMRLQSAYNHTHEDLNAFLTGDPRAPAVRQRAWDAAHTPAGIALATAVVSSLPLDVLVFGRTSTAYEAYDRLCDFLKDAAARRLLPADTVASVTPEVKRAFLSYLMEDDRRMAQWLIDRERFVSEMRARSGGAHDEGVWEAVWVAWVLTLVVRMPVRWADDGRWGGVVPTAPKRSGLLTRDVNVQLRVALGNALRTGGSDLLASLL